MKTYRIASQVFLALSLFGWLAWILTRFQGPIMSVSYEGCFYFTITCLLFVIAIGVAHMTVEKSGG